MEVLRGLRGVRGQRIAPAGRGRGLVRESWPLPDIGHVFVVLFGARWAQKAIGDTGLDIATRLLGLFLAAMGVQFMLDGLTDTFLKST